MTDEHRRLTCDRCAWRTSKRKLDTDRPSAPFSWCRGATNCVAFVEAKEELHGKA